MQFFSLVILSIAKPDLKVKTLTCLRHWAIQSADTNHKKPTLTKTVLGMGWLACA
jgi:hypothetical protein